MDNREGASSATPSDHDCEVVHAPGAGTFPAAHETREPALGDTHGASPFVGASEEKLFWEAHHDLLLTLLETGSRAKGVLHALAPHCLLPFKRITLEVLNDIDAPRLRLLLSTTQAVLLAFHRHPTRLSSLLLEKDDQELAYAFFDAAAHLAVLGLERADQLRLGVDTRTQLFDLCRVLLAPGGGNVPDWVRRTEHSLRVSSPETLAPPEIFDARAVNTTRLATNRSAPTRSELSVYVQLSRHAEVRLAAEMGDDSNTVGDDSSDTETRAELLNGFHDVLPGLENLGTTPGHTSRRQRMPAAHTLVSSQALPHTLLPQDLTQLASDVASYTTESLRAHARLLDAETFARRCAFDATRGQPLIDSRVTQESGAPTSNDAMLHNASTRTTLSVLTDAAHQGAHRRASPAARDAAAAAIRLGRAVGAFSRDANDIETAASGLRVYVTAALAAHPTALAEVRACLASTFLVVPFRTLPPLSEDAVVLRQSAMERGAGASPESKTAVAPHPLLDTTGTLRRAAANTAAAATTSPSWLALVSAGLCFLDDADDAPAGEVNANIDPLPPFGASLDKVLSATILAATAVTSSSPTTRGARDALAALARRAESLAMATPLVSRHVSAVVAIAGLVEQTCDIQTYDETVTASHAVSSLKRAVLGESTPFGPSLSDAALKRAPRDVRLEFVRRAVGISPETTTAVLALAGGWLLAEMRADASGHENGDDDVASSTAVFSAALDAITNAGWVCAPNVDGDDTRTTGGGWYGHRPGQRFATKERLTLCLLAFHGASKKGRRKALAEAAVACCGKNKPKTRRDGVLAQTARAHLFFIFAHCAVHFSKSPVWLEQRVRDVLRGEESVERRTMTAGDAALDENLFETHETVASESTENDAVSRLPPETLHAVRDAALAMANHETARSTEGSKTFVTLADLAAASARSRNAAWAALCALPANANSHTLTERESTSTSPSSSVGGFSFAWACVARCRDEALAQCTSPSRESIRALHEVVVALDAGAAMASPAKMALTCLAADALSRLFAAAAGRASADPARAMSDTLRSDHESDAAAEPSWLALTKLSVSLASATRRWTSASLTQRMSPSDARAVGLLLSAGINRVDAAPVLDAISPGLARETSDVLGNDDRWLTRRDAALRGAQTAERAARAYLDGTDVAAALFAAQMATRAALEATTRTARADASLGERAAAAATARVLLDAIAEDPTTEFVAAVAREASGVLRDAGPGSSPELLAAARASGDADAARRPCPAVAIATLRGDDSPLAVDAVLHAAAGRVMTARELFFDLDECDVSFGDIQDRDATLAACVSLLVRSDVSLSATASVSLLDVLSNSSSATRTVFVLVEANKDKGFESAKALTKLATHNSPTTRRAAAAALRGLLGASDANYLDDSGARHNLLRALLGQLPDACVASSSARDATKCASLFFELAFADGSVDDGAVAVADAFAALVACSATGSTVSSSQTFRKVLHTLAGFLAPDEVVARVTRKRSDVRARDLFSPDALPSVPTTMSSPLRSPSRASAASASASTTAPPTSVPRRTPSRGGRPTTAHPFSTRRRLDVLRDALAGSSPGASGTTATTTSSLTTATRTATTSSNLLSTSLFGDLDVALGGMAGLEGFEGRWEGWPNGLAGIGLGLGGGDFRDLRDNAVNDREMELARNTARAAAMTAGTANSTSSRNRALGVGVSGGYGMDGMDGIGLDDDDDDAMDDDAAFSDDAAHADSDFAEIASAADTFSVFGRRFAPRSRDPRGARAGGGDRRDLNVCTFVSSGASFTEQHWYFCYTCDLTTSRGCCSACARACHRGHKLVYSRLSRFFCDCGAGNAHDTSCQCLTPRSAAASAVAADVEAESRAAASAAETAAAAAAKTLCQELRRTRHAAKLGPRPVTEDSDSESETQDAYALLDDDAAFGNDDDDDEPDVVDVVPHARREALRDALRNAGLTSGLVATCERVCLKLRSASASVGDPDATKPPPMKRLAFPVSGTATAAATSETKLAHLRRSFKAGSFETKPSPDHAPPVEVQLAIASGTVKRSCLSCSRNAGMLAVAEGDKVCILDAGAIAGVGGVGAVGPSATAPAVETTSLGSSGAPGGTVEISARVGVRPLSRNPVPFDVAHVLWNPLNDHYLAVSGFRECVIFVLDDHGVVIDRLRVGPENWCRQSDSHETFATRILNVLWVPNSNASFAVVLRDSVVVFDLSKSALSPTVVVRLDQPENADNSTGITGRKPHASRLVDAAFVSHKGTTSLLLLCENGETFVRAFGNGVAFFHETRGDLESDFPKHVLVLDSDRVEMPDQVHGAPGASLMYSAGHQLALVSFAGGATVALRVDSGTDGAETTTLCVLLERDDSYSEHESDLETEKTPVHGFSCWADISPPPPPHITGAPPGPIAPPAPEFVALSQRLGGASCLVSLAENCFEAQVLLGDASTEKVGTASSTTLSTTLSTALITTTPVPGTTPPAPTPAPKALGHCGYHPVDMPCAFLFVLREDGSLQVFLREPPPAAAGAGAVELQRRQLERAAANATARSARATRLATGTGDSVDDEGVPNELPSSSALPEISEPKFPFDFFERSVCVTLETNFGGAFFRGKTSEAVRFALQSEQSHGGVEAPCPGPVSCVLSIAKPGHVICGVRVHVGDGSTARIPPSVRIGKPPPTSSANAARGDSSRESSVSRELRDPRRVVSFEAGARRWYDIPLTPGETLQAKKTLELTFGAATSSAIASRLDHLEVYAMSKTDFGWELETAAAATETEAAHANSVANEFRDDTENDPTRRVSRLERLVRHSCETPRQTQHEEHTLRAALASLARVVAFEPSDAAKEAAATMALVILKPNVSSSLRLVDDTFGLDTSTNVVWVPETATRRLAWRVLLAVCGGDTAAERKDHGAIARVAQAASALVAVDARRGPCPIDASVFHDATRAAARFASRRPALFASSPAARATTTTLVRLSTTMLEAGAGSWDAVENATALAALAVAVAETVCFSFSEKSESVRSGPQSPNASTAVRLVTSLVFAGRDDQRRAFVDALTDALAEPAPRRDTTDYRSALSPAGFPDKAESFKTKHSHDEEPKSSSSPPPLFGLHSQTSTPQTANTQFSCDVCDNSPITVRRWHCAMCVDYDVCDACYRATRGNASGDVLGAPHPNGHDSSHAMVPFECVTQLPRFGDFSDGNVRGASASLFGTMETGGETETETETRKGAPRDGAKNNNGYSRSAPSAGRVALVNALAVASTDVGVLGPMRGINELAPFFVLLRRLCFAHEHYALAAVAAAVEGAEQSVAQLAFSFSDVSGTIPDFDQKTRIKRLAVHEKALLRLSLLSALCEIGKTHVCVSGALASAFAEPKRGAAFVQNLYATVERAALALCDARGGSTSTIRDSSPFPDSAISVNNVWFGDWRRPAASAFDDAPPCAALDDRTPGATTGFGALLDADPPFATSAERFVSETARDELTFQSRLFDVAVGVLAQLVTTPSADNNNTEPFVALSLENKDAWCTLLGRALCGLGRGDAGDAFGARGGGGGAACTALREIAGGNDACRAVRDRETLSGLFHTLAKCALPEPGPWFEQRAPYAASLKSSSVLAAACVVAKARPRSWQSFVAESTEKSLPTIARLAVWAPEPARLDALCLLENAISETLDAATNLVVGTDFALFFNCFIGSVEVSDAMRTAASAVARAAWRVSPAGSNARREIARATFAALPWLAPLGGNSKEAFHFARWCLEHGDLSDFQDLFSVESDILSALAARVANRIEVLGTHRNASVYAALSRLSAAEPPKSADDFFTLETTPSVFASARCAAIGDDDKTSAFATRSLDTSLSTDLWHTHCAISAKLRAPNRVSQILVSAPPFASSSRAVRASRFSVFLCDDPSVDVATLKAKSLEGSVDGNALWTRIAVCTMAPNKHECAVVFPTPVTFCAIAVRFESFLVSPDKRARETTRCPRCTRHVTDRHGVCSHCRENAHQCRRCRNINYERPDAFLCNECGHSRYARVTVKLTSREMRGALDSGYEHGHTITERPRLVHEDDAARALVALEQESAIASRARELLRERRDALCLQLLGGEETSGYVVPAVRTGSFARPKRAAPGSSGSYGSSLADARAACASAYGDLVASERRKHALRVSLTEFAQHRNAIPSSGGSSESGVGSVTSVSVPSPFPLVPPPVPAEDDYGCAFTFVTFALPLCVSLVDKGGASVANQLVANGTLAGALRASHATLDETITGDARRLLSSTAGASSPETALALSDVPYARAKALLESVPRAPRNYRAMQPEARVELGLQCRAVVDLLRAASTSVAVAFARTLTQQTLSSCQTSGWVPPAEPDALVSLRARLFHLASLALALAGADADVTICEQIYLPTLRLFTEPSRTPPELRDATARAALATRPGVSFETDDQVFFGTEQVSLETHDQVSLEKNALEATCDANALAAMRGAGAWALRLAFASGSRAVRSEAGELLRTLARDSDGAAFCLLSSLVGKFGDENTSGSLATEETTTSRTGFSGDLGETYFDVLESVLTERSGSTLHPNSAYDFAKTLFLKERGFVLKLLESVAAATQKLCAADSGTDFSSNKLSQLNPDLGQGLIRGVEVLCGVLETLANGNEDVEDEVSASSINDAFAEIENTKFSSSVVDARLAAVLREMSPDGMCLNTLFHVSIALRALVHARSVDTNCASEKLTDLIHRVAGSNRTGLEESTRVATRALRVVAGLEGPVITNEGDVTTGGNSELLSGNATGNSHRLLTSAHAGEVLSSLCRLALPPAPNAETQNVSTQMRLLKSHTQEEFIRGAMTRNPYDAHQIKVETMRDVKNFICRTLDMHGLCDDDYGMELVVRGKIIALDLAVPDVYRGVWQKESVSPGDQPITTPVEITYRLTGLDGDATEDIVSEICDDANEGDENEEDLEVVFGTTCFIRQARGVEALLALTPLLSGKGACAFDNPNSRRSETTEALAQLLAGVAQLPENRRALLNLNAIPTLLAEASRLFSGDLTSSLREPANAASRERGVETLLLVEKLLSEEIAVAGECAERGGVVLGDDLGKKGSSGVSEKAPRGSATLKPGGLTRSLSGAFAQSQSSAATETKTKTWSAVVSKSPSRPSSPAPFGSFPSLDAFVDDTAGSGEGGAAAGTRENSAAILDVAGEFSLTTPTPKSTSPAARHTRVFLSTLAELCVSSVGEHPGSSQAKRRVAAAATLARVLPRLAAHDDVAAAALAKHVTGTFQKLHALDELAGYTGDTKDTGDTGGTKDTSDTSLQNTSYTSLQMSLRCCASLAEGIAGDADGEELKKRLLRCGAVDSVTGYLLDVAFAGEGARGLDKASGGWSAAIQRPAVALALTALRGLVIGHRDAAVRARDAESAVADSEDAESAASSSTEQALRLPPLLHALESVSLAQVGTLSETVIIAMEEADDSGRTRDEITSLRQTTREGNLKRAMELRERTLKSMGMTRVSPSPPGSPQKFTPTALGGSPDGSHSAGGPLASSPGFSGTSPLGVSLGTSPGEFIAVLASPASMRGVELVGDDDDDDDACAPACRVCREGYASKPTELLGVYVFCIQVRDFGSRKSSLTSGSRMHGKQVSTVSHFNAIHFSCHERARAADAALSKPKREWEGASLRNGETFANNLLPLPAGAQCAVSIDAVVAATEQWWDRVGLVGASAVSSASASSGRGAPVGSSSRAARLTSHAHAGGPGNAIDPSQRLTITLNDIALLFGRFATGGDFSRDAKGGGRRSNARAVPAMLLLALSELERSCSENAGAEKKALHELTSGSGRVSEVSYGVNLPAALVLSLLITPWSVWLASRRDVCAAAITHAARHRVSVIGATEPEAKLSSPTADGDTSSPSVFFAAVKPALIFVGLIDKMHAALQPSRRRSRDGKGLAVAGGEFVADDDKKEKEDDEMKLNSSKEQETRALVRQTLASLGGRDADETFDEWLEEAEDANCAMELFDVMECLADILAPSSGNAPESADSFVAKNFTE